MLFKDIPRLELGNFPTPLVKLNNLGTRLGHEALYSKRDDINPLGMGGNKLRNLEFLLADALSNKCDIVIAAGGLQSNQCRLTAAACAKLGLECILVHNDERPSFYQGNMLLNHLMGVKEVYLGKVCESDRGQYVASLASELRASGRRPYVVEQCPLGSLGYAEAAAELVEQARNNEISFKHVAIVGAMGGTAAGFAFGTALLDRPFHVHVISVEYSHNHLFSIMQELWQGMAELTGITPRYDLSEVITIYDEYLGPGYAVPTPESLRTARMLASTEGFFVENVYNAKTLHGFCELVKRGIIPHNEAACYIHTGGAPALFAQAQAWQENGTAH